MSLLLQVAGCFFYIIFHCTAWPSVGEKANSDAACVAKAQNGAICTYEYAPVCAKLAGKYIQGPNICDFCRKYGTTDALILQGDATVRPASIKTRFISYLTGLKYDDREFSCKNLQVGGFIYEDPECKFLFGRKVCTKELNPHCATTDNYNRYIGGNNKCVFCSTYGNIKDARILSIGNKYGEKARCQPFKIGTKANEDLGCRYLANRKDQACTLELNPVCATLSNSTEITGGNKCDFCSRYGNTDAVIKICPINN